MEEIKKYVMSHKSFDYGSMLREIKFLISDLKYLEEHFRRTRFSKNFDVLCVPFEKPSDKLLFSHIIRWYKYDEDKWEEMFFIRSALEFVFKDQFIHGWVKDEDMISLIENKLSGSEINFFDVVSWYEHH